VLYAAFCIAVIVVGVVLGGCGAVTLRSIQALSNEKIFKSMRIRRPRSFTLVLDMFLVRAYLLPSKVAYDPQVGL